MISRATHKMIATVKSKTTSNKTSQAQFHLPNRLKDVQASQTQALPKVSHQTLPMDSSASSLGVEHSGKPTFSLETQILQGVVDRLIKHPNEFMEHKDKLTAFFEPLYPVPEMSPINRLRATDQQHLFHFVSYVCMLLNDAQKCTDDEISPFVHKEIPSLAEYFHTFIRIAFELHDRSHSDVVKYLCQTLTAGITHFLLVIESKSLTPSKKSNLATRTLSFLTNNLTTYEALHKDILGEEIFGRVFQVFGMVCLGQAAQSRELIREVIGEVPEITEETSTQTKTEPQQKTISFLRLIKPTSYRTHGDHSGTKDTPPTDRLEFQKPDKAFNCLNFNQRTFYLNANYRRLTPDQFSIPNHVDALGLYGRVRATYSPSGTEDWVAKKIDVDDLEQLVRLVQEVNINRDMGNQVYASPYLSFKDFKTAVPGEDKTPALLRHQAGEQLLPLKFALIMRKLDPLPALPDLHQATQIADAIQKMHKKHIVHNDLKLDNILLDSNGRRAVPVDFGISFYTNEANEKAFSVDQNLIGGSYPPPEAKTYRQERKMIQPSDLTAETKKIDVWTFCYLLLIHWFNTNKRCIYVRMEHGRVNAKSDKFYDTLKESITNSIDYVTQHQSDYTPSFFKRFEIIKAGLTFEPSRRPTMDEILTKLSALESRSLGSHSRESR